MFLYNTLPSHKLQFYCGQHKVAEAGIWKVKQQKNEVKQFDNQVKHLAKIIVYYY